jgi:2-oxoglutarate dehydrogenase E1 component
LRRSAWRRRHLAGGPEGVLALDASTARDHTRNGVPHRIPRYLPLIHYSSNTHMAIRTKTLSATSTAVLDPPNGERERVFDAFRRWGYLQADLDPLGFLRPLPHPDLQIDNEFAQEARRVYCGTVGAEFMHITDPARRRWIQERLEGRQPDVDQPRALDLLIRAELFEQVLQQRYLGNKRFSLEGVTALIPLMDEILEAAGQQGVGELVMGMSHRGRLNVIVHVARRAAEEVFAGFEDVDPRSVLGSGDVKYHMGATGEYLTRSGAKVHIHMVSNPSHLEAVDPVTIGRTRAKQDRAGEIGTKKYLPLLVHGDAAFAGQGIVAETLNYADLPGYTVGGTVHIIANNLIGFTTIPRELHSSRFSAQLARRQSVPIFHVNGEDVDAVIRVGRIALDYRYAFGTDVVIDMIGYRRHGHSEVDDPTITQPLLYKAIKEHPPLWETYSEDIGVDP